MTVNSRSRNADASPPPPSSVAVMSALASIASPPADCVSEEVRFAAAVASLSAALTLPE